MMPASPIFKANFSDIKPVKTRGVMQFIFEVKVEGGDADRALEILGGFPVPHAEMWVGIATLDKTKASPEPRNAPDKASAPKERRPFNSLALPAQAAMRCNEPEFRRFLAQREGFAQCEYLSLDMAAAYAREICGVTSRSQITDADESGERWRALDRAYLDWRHSVPSYEGIAR